MHLARRRQAKAAYRAPLTAVAPDLEPFLNATHWPDGGPLSQHLLLLTKPHTQRAFWMDSWASPVLIWFRRWPVLWFVALKPIALSCMMLTALFTLLAIEGFTVRERVPCWHSDAATADIPCAAPAPHPAGDPPSEGPSATDPAAAPSQASEYATIEHQSPWFWAVFPFCVLPFFLPGVLVVMVFRSREGSLMQHVRFLYLLYAADYNYSRSQRGLAGMDSATACTEVRVKERRERRRYVHTLRQDGTVTEKAQPA
jgi:hypothetical protein